MRRQRRVEGTHHRVLPRQLEVAEPGRRDQQRRARPAVAYATRTPAGVAQKRTRCLGSGSASAGLQAVVGAGGRDGVMMPRPTPPGHTRPRSWCRDRPSSRREAEAVGDRPGLGPVAHAELGQDVGDVDAGCLVADVEGLGDLVVGASVRDQRQDLQLPWGEAQLVGGRWRRWGCGLGVGVWTEGDAGAAGRRRWGTGSRGCPRKPVRLSNNRNRAASGSTGGGAGRSGRCSRTAGTSWAMSAAPAPSSRRSSPGSPAWSWT
jgi:hypothetical protein